MGLATSTPVRAGKLFPRAATDHMRDDRRAGSMSGPLSKAEEQALVERAKSGDRRAFEALVRHNAERLYAVVLRFSATETDAEEATQEAFIRAWRSIDRFRGDSRLFTWLYPIGVNEAKRILERRPHPSAVVSVEERSIDHITDDAPEPEPRAEQGELRDVLEHAIRRLPEKYRSAVVLRDVEGLSTAEAAELLGLREAAFKSRLHRGRMALRRDVADYVLDPRDAISGSS